ncbi:peptidase M14, partial [Candidatus Peregrinibacteria bacterium]|nr:peptidase M14 [Candidatus Peregrinibacteria bacterium]
MKYKNMKSIAVCGIFILGLLAYAYPNDIPDPESFFGHKPGADFKLIRWEKIVEYFNLLGENSGRIDVQELGETTLGHPFILTIISSQENLANLEKYRNIS